MEAAKLHAYQLMSVKSLDLLDYEEVGAAPSPVRHGGMLWFLVLILPTDCRDLI